MLVRDSTSGRRDIGTEGVWERSAASIGMASVGWNAIYNLDAESTSIEEEVANATSPEPDKE
ncbi:hypothetical protein OC842_004710 [Tilletia horrida]|uniref:Uncharacterized protein n=1 Tax=Tilletia horrida TaxID=155126 RepID=A0AAN6JQ14_9BASI|nr:hypothetical protein OC842_004710 [Tilletia horrida]